MKWTPRIIRDGASRVDHERKLVVFRKARSLKVAESPSDYRYVQAKADGVRCIVYRGIDQLYAFTTQGTCLRDQYPDHPLWMKSYIQELVHDSWLDVELVVPLKGREAVKTALAQRDENLTAAAFGASFIDRDCDMELVDYRLVKRGVPVLPVWKVDSAFTMPKRLSEMGYDGVVYKDSQYGKWAKLKHRKTIDVIVTGIIPGCGKYSGMCGSLRCSVMISDFGALEIARCGGMDDAVRAEITDRDIGRTCEVAYEKIGTRGRLQHPRFISWRDDEKLADDCTYDQDERLGEVLAQLYPDRLRVPNAS